MVDHGLELFAGLTGDGNMLNVASAPLVALEQQGVFLPLANLVTRATGSRCTHSAGTPEGERLRHCRRSGQLVAPWGTRAHSCITGMYRYVLVTHAQVSYD